MEEQIQSAITQTKQIIREVKKAVVGKDETVIKVLLAMLAGGHILIEDIPGVGKTTMALAFSRACAMSQNRVQFTPDVLPADITGFSIYRKDTGKFEYQPGAVMCNLLLADEINRTSPKTQSALLEVMEEGNVTVDGITREVPKPFIVMATQNPIGSSGTQMLPESQLDRFMIKLNMGYPDLQSEVDILKARHSENPIDHVHQVASAEDIVRLQRQTEQIYVDDRIYNYIASLAQATRQHQMLRLGISPRGTLALTAAAKATALLRGRDYVTSDDVRFMLRDVFAHRLLLSTKARMQEITVEQVIGDVVRQVPVPVIGDEI